MEHRREKMKTYQLLYVLGNQNVICFKLDYKQAFRLSFLAEECSKTTENKKSALYTVFSQKHNQPLT